MEDAGIQVGDLDDTSSALCLNIFLAMANAVGTIASIFVIDNLGRRYIILRTIPIIAFSWVVVSVGFIV